jgi:hypothetical protein
MDPNTFFLVFWEAVGNRVHLKYDVVKEEFRHRLNMAH